MIKKIFTHINVGSFRLRHRIVLDCGRIFSDFGEIDIRTSLLMKNKLLGGALIIVDPGLEPWSRAAGRGCVDTNDVDGRWLQLFSDAKAGRHYLLARISPNLPGAADPSNNAIERVVDGYVDLARQADSIGFDGIEIDATADSAIDQFVRPKNLALSLRKEDIAERIGVLMELIGAVQSEIGRERVGVRMSFFASANTLDAENIDEEVSRLLNDHELAYVHLVNCNPPMRFVVRGPESLKRTYAGVLVSAKPRSLALAIELVGSRWADAVSFSGREINEAFLNELRSKGLGGDS